MSELTYKTNEILQEYARIKNEILRFKHKNSQNLRETLIDNRDELSHGYKKIAHGATAAIIASVAATLLSIRFNGLEVITQSIIPSGEKIYDNTIQSRQTLTQGKIETASSELETNTRDTTHDEILRDWLKIFDEIAQREQQYSQLLV